MRWVLFQGKHQSAQDWNGLPTTTSLSHPRVDEGEEEVMMVEMCLSEACEENYTKDCEMLRYPGDHISIYDKTVRIISSTAVGTDQEHF